MLDNIVWADLVLEVHDSLLKAVSFLEGGGWGGVYVGDTAPAPLQKEVVVICWKCLALRAGPRPGQLIMSQVTGLWC